jgi:hypothetical protein
VIKRFSYENMPFQYITYIVELICHSPSMSHMICLLSLAPLNDQEVPITFQVEKERHYVFQVSKELKKQISHNKERKSVRKGGFLLTICYISPLYRLLALLEQVLPSLGELT